MSIKKSATNRKAKVFALLFLAVGFIFSFLNQHRSEEQFGAGTISLGYSKENMQWLPVHYGMIALVCFLLAVVCYFIDHHKESNK
jgi:uncharacterized membrane protein YbaN (DUF454 family)